jgi:deoxyhypusine synthase
MKIADFIDKYYERFNSRELRESAEAYKAHIEDGNKMLLSMAGAMSTAGMGKIIAEMIREGKIHAISTTGANLEEDIFRYVARSKYVECPNYKDLTPEDEENFLKEKLARVTDILIPEDEAVNSIEDIILEKWLEAAENEEKYFPHEFLFQIIDDLEADPDAAKEESWVFAAKEFNIPIFIAGWEDSTLGNFAVACIMDEDIPKVGHGIGSSIKTGLDYLECLANWYKDQKESVGFFQIGGGIAGDFAICVVPMIKLELEEDVPFWGYYCQISDSTTSYGSYSGAVPNEKITWAKIDAETPSFMIESDATIVAPLIFAYVLEM